MKQRKVILSLVLFLFGILLVACGTDNRMEPGLYEIGNEEFAGIVSSTNEDGYFVYIGRPTCQYCREFQPVLEKTLVDLELSMFYFQTAKARYADEEKMLELLAPLNIEGIPIVVYLVNGEVVDSIIGVQTQEVISGFIEANGGIN